MTSEELQPTGAWDTGDDLEAADPDAEDFNPSVTVASNEDDVKPAEDVESP
jgi:hypothetical protein